MATLFFTVFEAASQTSLGVPLQQSSVEITGGSLQSDAIVGSGRQKRTVRLFADADCFIAYWSDDPTAAADGSAGIPVGAENPEYVDIEAGHKIAVIQRV